MRATCWIPIVALAAALPSGAAADASRIEDNSFLIEEAYNQEPGVLHHISTFQRSSLTKRWLYTFTEEWPVGGQTHQVSLTLPVAHGDGPAAPTGLGDLMLHYRYALFQEETSPVVSVVRLSLLLPTGDRAAGLGEGAPGAQVAFPLSVKLGDHFVSHSNAFATWVPASEDNLRATSAGYGLGQGLIWLTRPAFNLLVEVLWTETGRRADDGAVTRTSTLTVSPGFRAALNFESGLQVVWGLAAPIGVGPSRGDDGVFLYLSFEHPLWTPR